VSDRAGDEGEEPPHRGADGLRGWRALAAMAVAARAAAGVNRAARQADPEDPGIVALSDRAGKVADRAFKLGDAGREDARAVAELVALAGDSKRTLENAERFSRQGARHCEDQKFNRAHRLLVAAMSGRPVEPPSSDTRRTFKVVKAFRALAPAQGWELLVSREPRLAELEAETRRGAFAAAIPASDERLSPGRRSIRREIILAGSELGDRLRELVGPLAPATDPLVKSRAAFAFAISHLADVDEAASR
jgi:hypothetical protein